MGRLRSRFMVGSVLSARNDLKVDEERQVIRGDPGERCPDDFGSQDIDGAADKNVIDPQHRQSRRKGGPRAMEPRRGLSVPQM